MKSRAIKETVISLPLFMLALAGSACSRKAEHSQLAPDIPLISLEPEYEDWREVLEAGEPRFFGVEGPADHPLLWIHPIHIAPGPENGVIVLEDRSVDIKLVHPEEGVITAYGKGMGSGPGEFRDTFSSVWVPGTGILVADGPNQRITVFTEAGEYVRDIHPEITCHTLANSGGYLWSGTMVSNVIDRAYIIDLETGRVLKEVGGRYSDASWAESFYSRCSLDGSSHGILITVQYPYEVHAYEPDGDLKGIFGRKAKWLGPPEKLDLGTYGSTYSPRGGMVGDVATFPDGMIIVSIFKTEQIGTFTGGLPKMQSTKFYDLFRQDGEWLTTVPGEDLLPGHTIGCWTIATDGSFWGFVSGDYPRIVRVPLHFNPDLR